MKTKILILALVPALSFLLVGLALAQGTTAIDWWVVGSGGGPVSAEGEVALNATLGQPVIGASNGDAISLMAGYWHGHCPAAVTPTSASISLNGADVTLRWDSDPANAGGFEVHRSTSPYFTPDSGSLWTTLPVGSASYTDMGAAGSAGENYSYIVRGLSSCGAPSGYEKRLGEFDFGLVPGG